MRFLFGTLFRFIGGNPLLFVFGVLLAVLTWKVAEAEHLKGKLARAYVTADSLQLDAMNERAVNNQVVSKLIDSVTRLSVKPVVQIRPHRDTALAADVVAHVEPIAGDLVAVPAAAPDTSVAFYEFPLERRPYHGAFQVAIHEGQARMKYQIGLEPARFRARVACGAPLPPQNLRPATLSLQGPSWLMIDSVAVQAAPGTCNPPKVQKEKFTLVRRYWWVPPALVLTYVLGRAR